MGVYRSWESLANRIDQMLDTQGDGSGSTDQAVAGKSISSVLNANPIVVTATSHGRANGDIVYISGVGGCTAANGVFKVANKSANTFELNTTDDETVAGNGAYTTGGTVYPAFTFIPDSSQRALLTRIMVSATNNSALAHNDYLGETALSNGVVVEVRNADGLVKTLTPAAVTTWAQWALAAGVDIPVTDTTPGSIGAVRWSFFKDAGDGIVVNGANGEYLIARIQDDMSGLVSHEMSVKGVYTG